MCKALIYSLSMTANTILEKKNLLDKFMGDAVLAFWNAPDPQLDHALRAVRVALAILKSSRQVYTPLQGPSYTLNFI